MSSNRCFRIYRHNSTVIAISLDRTDTYVLTVNGDHRASARSAETLVLLAESIIQDLQYEDYLDEQEALHQESVRANYAARGQLNLF